MFTLIELKLKGKLILRPGGRYLVKCSTCKQELSSSTYPNHVTCKGKFVRKKFFRKIGICRKCGKSVYDDGCEEGCNSGVDIDTNFELKSFDDIKKEKAASAAKEKEEEEKRREAAARDKELETAKIARLKKKGFKVKPGCYPILARCEEDHFCDPIFMTSSGLCRKGSMLKYELGVCGICKHPWFEDQESCENKVNCEGGVFSLNEEIFEKL